jgi:hypothetical protein
MELPMQSTPNDRIVEKPSNSIGRFVLKTVIVSIAITVSVIVIGNAVFTRLEDSFDEAMRFGGRKMLIKLEAVLDKAADPNVDMSPEQKKKILADIQAIAKKWRPLIVEASSVISGSSNTSGNEPGK